MDERKPEPLLAIKHTHAGMFYFVDTGFIGNTRCDGVYASATFDDKVSGVFLTDLADRHP